MSDVVYGREGASAWSAQLGAFQLQAHFVVPEGKFRSFVQAVPLLNNDGMYGTLIRLVGDAESAQYLRNQRRVSAVIFSVARSCDQYFDNWRTTPSIWVTNPGNRHKLVTAIADALAADRRDTWGFPYEMGSPAEIKW